MNKISKKIVSLVTMAAFAVTLVPAAAFAEVGKVDDSTAEVSTVSYNTAKVTINVGPTDVTEADNYIVWATDAEGNVVDQNGTTGVNYGAATGTPIQIQNWEGADGAEEEAVVLTKVAAADSVTINATFATPGEYTLHAALNEKGAQSLEDAAVKEITVENASFNAYGAAVGETSSYGFYDKDGFQAEKSVAVDTDLTTTFKINDGSTDMTTDTLDNVVIWAVNTKTNQVSGLSKVTVVDGLTAGSSENVGANGKAYHFTNVSNDAQVKVQFSAPGDYILYAGEGTLYSTANANKIGTAWTTVNVTDNTEVDSMEISAYINGSSADKTEKYEMEFDEDTNTYKLDLTTTNFKFDRVDYVTLEGIAKEADGTPAKNKTINFTVNEPNTVVHLNPATDNTEYDGLFQTVFRMENQKNAVITVTEPESGVSYDVLVIAQKTSATDIDSVKDGGYVLATTDKHWDADVNAELGDAVQFMVTDEKGDPVEGLTKDNFRLDITEKADGSDLTVADLDIVPAGDGLYTLSVLNAKAGDKTLTEGKYAVTVALKGVDSENDNIGVTFTAAEFGKTQDVELNVTANGVALDDQITLNTTATVSLVYVDENGVKIAGPTDFSWNATNSALAIKEVKDNYFTMKPDTIEHQGVVGSTVLVQAAVDGYGLVEKELTIVSSYNTYSLELDPAEGPVNEYNKVDLSVLNSDGDVAKTVNGTVKVVVADSSNEDAKVSVKQAKAVTKGEGALTVYASQETELELVVTVVDDNNKIVAADTLNYTVGAADPLAGRTVVMTVDSTEYVVNNNIITGDAAPYIDSAWRTMVPIRALAEAFDAEVYWNQDDETVTINFDAGTKIVMTVDETTYTVNGEETTMDTEPVNTGSRVYVPIRFAAEAMGFHVTPLYNDAGLTASVVFQR